MMMVRAAHETPTDAVAMTTCEKSAEERWVALNKKYVEFLIDCALQSMTTDDADDSEGEEEEEEEEEEKEAAADLLQHSYFHPQQHWQRQQLGNSSDTDNYYDDRRPTVPIDSNARIDVATAAGGGKGGENGASTVVAMLGPGPTADDDGRCPASAAQQRRSIHQAADKQLQLRTKVHCACGRYGEMTTVSAASTTNRDACCYCCSSFSASADAACSNARPDLKTGRSSQTCCSISSRQQSGPSLRAEKKSASGLLYNIQCCNSSLSTIRCASYERQSCSSTQTVKTATLPPTGDTAASAAVSAVAARPRLHTRRHQLFCQRLAASSRSRRISKSGCDCIDSKHTTRASLVRRLAADNLLSCAADKRRSLISAAKLRQQRNQWLNLKRQQRKLGPPRSRCSGDSLASCLQTFDALKERRRLSRRTSSGSSNSSSSGSSNRKQLTRFETQHHQKQQDQEQTVLFDIDNSASLQRLTISDGSSSFLHHATNTASLSTTLSLADNIMKEPRYKLTQTDGGRSILSRCLAKERNNNRSSVATRANYSTVLSRSSWPFSMSDAPFMQRTGSLTSSHDCNPLKASTPPPLSSHSDAFSKQSWQAITSPASIFPAVFVTTSPESAITDPSSRFRNNDNSYDVNTAVDSVSQDSVLNLTSSSRHTDQSETNVSPLNLTSSSQVVDSESSSSNTSPRLRDTVSASGSSTNASPVPINDINANNICRWMALNKSTLRLIVNDLVTSVFGVHADEVTSPPPSTSPDDAASNHGDSDCFLDDSDADLLSHQRDVLPKASARSVTLTSEAKLRSRMTLSSVTAVGGNSKRHHHHFHHHPHHACASSRAASLKWKSSMMRRMLLENEQMPPQLHQRHQQQQQQQQE